MRTFRWIPLVAAVGLAALAGCTADDYPTSPRNPGQGPIEPIEVTFTYDVPTGVTAPTSIDVRGTFNDWTQTAGWEMTETSPGHWELTVELMPDTYEYKYVFNGDGWSSDMCNDATWGDPADGNKVWPGVTNCLPGGNAVLVVGGAPPEPVDITLQYLLPTGVTAPTSIDVRGNFNDWTQTAGYEMTEVSSGVWEVTIQLMPVTYEYKYVFNGDGWASDMCNDATWGDPNNGFKVDPAVGQCLGGGNGVLEVDENGRVGAPNPVTTMFVYVPPAGLTVTSVSVAGEMNGWDQSADAMVEAPDGSWYVVLSLVPDTSSCTVSR